MPSDIMLESRRCIRILRKQG